MNKDVIYGTVAGLAATVPMTIAFKSLNRRVRLQERLPIPPVEVTKAIVQKTGLSRAIDTKHKRKAFIWAGHYAYGAASGALFPLLAKKVNTKAGVLGGLLFGTGVWAFSYLGWLPAAGLLPPESKRPMSRLAVNVGAHMVWGAVLGAVFTFVGKRRF